MRHALRLAGLSLLCVLAGVAAERADAARRTRTAGAALATDSRFRAKGRIVARRQEPTRKLPAHETLELRLTRLDSASVYGLWLDSPLDASNALVHVPPYSITPRRDRTAVVRWDDAKDGLPFGATLEQLATQRFQLRDGTGEVIMTGTVPALRPPK